MGNWKAVAIDESITRFGQGLVRVAEGDYKGKVLKISASPEDRDYSENDPYFAFDFQLVDGPDGLGKSLRYIGMVTAAKADGSGGSWGLGRVLAALGADPSSLVGMNFDSYKKFAQVAQGLSAKLSGHEVGLEVADDTYSGRNNQTSIISRITGFFPAEEWDLRSRPRSATAPAVPATNGSAKSKATAAPASNIQEEANKVVAETESNLEDEISKLFAAPA